jgi:hypothetical protein
MEGSHANARKPASAAKNLQRLAAGNGPPSRSDAGFRPTADLRRDGFYATRAPIASKAGAKRWRRRAPSRIGRRTRPERAGRKASQRRGSPPTPKVAAPVLPPPTRSIARRPPVGSVASVPVRTADRFYTCVPEGQRDAAGRFGHLAQVDLEKPMSSSITAEGPTGTFAGLGRLRFRKTILSRLTMRRKSQNTSIVSCSPGQRR